MVGTSHRFASLEVRERLHVHPEECASAATGLAADGEAALLSTCNRLEAYVATDDVEAALGRVTQEFSRWSGLTPVELGTVLQIAVDERAAVHLLRVAAGLESPVPGEPQILGQVREAHATGAAGPLLDRLFRHAVHTGRRVRAETGLGKRTASLGTAAASLAAKALDGLVDRRVLVIGAGRMSEAAAAAFAAGGAQLVVANRTVEHGAALAARFDGCAVSLDEITRVVADVDVVISSTRSPNFVVTARELADRETPLLLVDLAVPRDLDPAIGGLAHCRLHHLDELAGTGIAPSASDLARAEAIVAEEAARFGEWQQALDVVPAIVALRRRAESIRLSELDRAKRELGQLPEPQRQAVEALTLQMVNKLLHAPTVRAKAPACVGDGVRYATVLEHLFALEETA